MSYSEVWRTDDKMSAPPLWTSTDNPHWWAETMLERIGVAVSELRDGEFDKPNDPATQWKLITFARWAYGHAVTGKNVSEGNSTKLDSAISKLDSLLSGQGDAAAKLDQIITLLDQHATGSLDAATVVDGIRALVHEKTATTA